MKPLYSYDPATGIAEAEYRTPRGTTIKGIARCHPDDKDMQSEKTGLTLADLRAEIAYQRDYRDNVLKPQIIILEHVADSIAHSKSYNEFSHENVVLRRQIRFLKNDLNTTQEIIAGLKKYIKIYIDEKENFYQKVRRNRNETE